METKVHHPKDERQFVLKKAVRHTNTIKISMPMRSQ